MADTTRVVVALSLPKVLIHSMSALAIDYMHMPHAATVVFSLLLLLLLPSSFSLTLASLFSTSLLQHGYYSTTNYALSSPNSASRHNQRHEPRAILTSLPYSKDLSIHQGPSQVLFAVLSSAKSRFVRRTSLSTQFAMGCTSCR